MSIPYWSQSYDACIGGPMNQFIKLTVISLLLGVGTKNAIAREEKWVDLQIRDIHAIYFSYPRSIDLSINKGDLYTSATESTNWVGVAIYGKRCINLAQEAFFSTNRVTLQISGRATIRRESPNGPIRYYIFRKVNDCSVVSTQY